MIERRDQRPPVTYTTFQARDLGGDTATLFKTACQDAVDRFKPEAIIVGASCTAELIQDNPAGLAGSMNLGLPVIALDLPSYQRKEGFGTDETFLQIVRHLAKPCERTAQITCNLIGPTALGFRHRDDITELTRMLAEMGIAVNVCAPMGARPSLLSRRTGGLRSASLRTPPRTRGPRRDRRPTGARRPAGRSRFASRLSRPTSTS